MLQGRPTSGGSAHLVEHDARNRGRCVAHGGIAGPHVLPRGMNDCGAHFLAGMVAGVFVIPAGMRECDSTATSEPSPFAVT